MSNTTEIRAEALKKLSGKNARIAMLNYLFLFNVVAAIALGFWIFTLVQNDYVYRNAYVQVSNTEDDFKDWSRDLVLSIYSETSGSNIHSDQSLAVILSKSDIKISGFNNEVSGSLVNVTDKGAVLATQIAALSTLKSDIISLSNNIARQATQQKINDLNNKISTYQNCLIQIKQYLNLSSKDNSFYIWSLVVLAVGCSILAFVLLSSLSQEYKIYSTLSKDNTDLIKNIEMVHFEISKLFSVKDNHAIFYFNKKITAKQQFSTFKIAKIVNKLVEMLEGFFQNLTKNLNNLIENQEDQGKLYKSIMPLMENQQNKIYEGSEITKRINGFWIEWRAKNKEINEVNANAKEKINESHSNAEVVNGRMNILRDSVQDTSKKIKRLGESAQSITQTTDLIGNVTKQIQVIALNTAIQASQAGESGKQFGVIAKEIERLAKNSDDAAQKIEALINIIQDDAKNAVEAMENSTKEVVGSTKMIDASIKNIDETRGLMKNLEGLNLNLQNLINENSELYASYAGDVEENYTEMTKLKENVSLVNGLYEKHKNMLEELIHFIRLSRNVD